MKQISFIFILVFFIINSAFSNTDIEFQKWKKNFRKVALKNNISETTFDIVMKNSKSVSEKTGFIIKNINIKI